MPLNLFFQNVAIFEQRVPQHEILDHFNSLGIKIIDPKYLFEEEV